MQVRYTSLRGFARLTLAATLTAALSLFTLGCGGGDSGGDGMPPAGESSEQPSSDQPNSTQDGGNASGSDAGSGEDAAGQDSESGGSDSGDESGNGGG